MSTDFWVRTGTERSSRGFFGNDELADVREFYAGLPGKSPTPLRRLPRLAADLGVGELLIKDESARFGLPAFKIAGARYAIGKLVTRYGKRLRHLACATAGNHGRAVAHAAGDLGLEAHVYVPFGTSPARIAALRLAGAHVVITSTGYDETVRLMADDASKSGWMIVSDTAWDAYEEIPRWIMAGYTQILDEAASDWGATPPDVVIVQAGVGSLAGAVAGWLVATFRPRTSVPSHRRTVGRGVPARIAAGRHADAALVMRADRDGRAPMRGGESAGLARARDGRRCGARHRRCGCGRGHRSAGTPSCWRSGRSGGCLGSGRCCRAHRALARTSTLVGPGDSEAVTHEPRVRHRDGRTDLIWPAAAEAGFRAPGGPHVWPAKAGRYSFFNAATHSLSAMIGSTRAARRAGMRQAAVPTAAISSATIRRATVSSGVIPNIRDSISPPSA